MTDEAAEETRDMVCYCMGVPKSVITALIARHGLREVEQVTDRCGAAGGCGTCAYEVSLLIREYWSNLPNSA